MKIVINNPYMESIIQSFRKMKIAFFKNLKIVFPSNLYCEK